MTWKTGGRIAFFVTKSGKHMKFQLLGAHRDNEEKFEVVMDDLSEASDQVRQAVEKLCQLYVRDDEKEPPAHEKLEVIRRIADYGSSLRSVIFKSSKAKSYARQIEENELQVTFFVNGSVGVHPPYGLMFGGLGVRPTDGFDDEAFREGFWSLKHGVSVVFSDSDRWPPVEEYLDDPPPFYAEHVNVFGVFHLGCIANAHGDTPLDWPKSRTFYSAKEFKYALKKNVDHHNIIYFFCHANGEKLRIGNTGDLQDDHLLAYELDSVIDECRPPAQGGLIFLNGCRTAVFSKRSGWLKATRQGGFSGFIGTEATIPTKFAWNFGNDLLQKLLAGTSSPIQALRELGRDHWPLGLLYGLYCIADVRVTPSVPTPFLQPIRNVNHSRKAYTRVGDSVMGSAQLLRVQVREKDIRP